jgi:DNA-directed RNA polymerase subunit RPC12/RpoP
MPIIIFCPACKVRLRMGDDHAGEAIECPRCDSMIAIPVLLPPPAPPAPPPKSAVPDEDEDEKPRRRKRVAPDDDEDEKPRRRRGRRHPEYHCPFCGSTARPYFKKKISPAGWIVCVLLLFFTICLFWIGLLIKEEYRVCPDCGMKVES